VYVPTRSESLPYRGESVAAARRYELKIKSGVCGDVSKG